MKDQAYSDCKNFDFNRAMSWVDFLQIAKAFIY